MTTISDKPPGRVDLAGFGLSPEDLFSLQALAAEWSAAVGEVFAESCTDPVVSAFAGETRLLAGKLGDPVWQDSWLRHWQKIYGHGFPSSTLAQLMSHALDLCERSLFSSENAVPRLHLALFSLLRRAVMAVVSCAVDLGEEARLAEVGLPGELAALGCLQELVGKCGQLAVLSVSVVNRDAFVHLSASDLQSLPGLVSSRIQKQLRAQDCLFSGRDSEWLLVLPEVRSMTQPALAAAYLQREFSQPIWLASGKALSCDVIVGAAMLPEHGRDPEAVIAASRLARWSLLTSHQTFGWFHPDIQADWNKRFALAAEFKAALNQETMQLYLQPQIDARSGECVGAELLLRWQRQGGDWVDPQLAMEIAEENAWRPLYTDWLFRSALRIAHDLEAAGAGVRLSLNLTAGDLLDEDLVEMIAQRLETWQMRGERFALELTESAMLLNRERCLETLFKLRDLGFRLALDDFGTGYSSLSHLVSLPVNELKIDRSFIIAMNRSDEHLRIVRTIIDLARDLEMTSLAEGVEEVAQVEQLQALGCHHIQGFLYAQPMPPEMFIAWLQSRQA
ncbi:MAG: EAL domain-containing protein [Azonexus sp.]|nr:EAL domain-containing protein [Azonexus sp.]